MAFGVKLPEQDDVDVEVARKIWTELAAVMNTKGFVENVKKEIKELKVKQQHCPSAQLPQPRSSVQFVIAPKQHNIQHQSNHLVQFAA